MKALITHVEFKDEKEGQYGTRFNFRIHYDGKQAYYTSKSRDQTKFVNGQEAEFTEEERSSKVGNPYFVVKPIFEGHNNKSNWGKNVKKEQSRYSGFATSYVKDLIVAGQIPIADWQKEAEEIFNFMVSLDKKV